MRRERIDGLPIVRFTRRLSPRDWAISTTVESHSGVRRWRVELSPRATDIQPMAQVQIDRESGRTEGVCLYASGKPWNYTRTVELEPSESLPSLVVFEFLPERLVWVRRRLRR